MFEVDDLEKDWTWLERFDLIVSRAMTRCFEDVEEFIRKAYDNL